MTTSRFGAIELIDCYKKNAQNSLMDTDGFLEFRFDGQGYQTCQGNIMDGIVGVGAKLYMLRVARNSLKYIVWSTDSGLVSMCDACLLTVPTIHEKS